MGRICVFCRQQKKMSNEHIFPQWLQKHLGVKQEALFIYSSGSQEPKRTLVYDKHLNGRVCRECNSGWMHNIEDDVKPILISMLDCLVPINITIEQSMNLAWWVYKIALMLDSTALHGSVIPQRHYDLALRRIAPTDFMIAIAYCADKIEKPAWTQIQHWPGLSQFMQSAELESQVKNTYRITFGFGSFMARVHYFPLRYRLFEVEQGAVQYIHPGNRDGFEWPFQVAIQNIHELDQSLVVSSDPEQDVEIYKRLLEMSLENPIDNDDALSLSTLTPSGI